MLVFVDSPWHVATAFLAFFVGLALSVGQRRLFRIPLSLSVALYCWHTAFCIVYFVYSVHYGADSVSYYTQSLTYDGGIAAGSKGIYYFVSFFSYMLGMSYGGVFLVANIVGYVGLLAFTSALREITLISGGRSYPLLLTLVFLPSVSFWSSSIGKDSIAFLAAGLTCWAAMDMRTRYFGIIVSVAALFLARPHIAAVYLVALALSAVMLSRASFFQRLVVGMLLIPLAATGLLFSLQYVGLGDATEIDDVGEYIERRQGLNMGGGSSIDISSMSIPNQMFSYLFRPLAFEVGSIFGIVNGFENLYILIIFVIFSYCYLKRRSSLDPLGRTFLIIFSGFCLLILSITTSNLGIAVRQKWMFVPMLVLVGFSYLPRRVPPRYWTRSANSPVRWGEARVVRKV